jgi:hypothetical protein
MGYYTSYSLTITRLDKKRRKIPRELELPPAEHAFVIYQLQKECDGARCALDGCGECNELSTWYSHEEDMIAFSQRFPDLLFCLHGVGDANNDMWDCYFHNGKLQRCGAKITFPPFNFKKLKVLEREEEHK